MKRFQNVLLSTFFIIFTFSACIPETGGGGTPIPAATYREIIDTSYGSHAQQKMDIYLPSGRTTINTRTIVLVHGGGWQVGDKDDLSYDAIIARIKITLPNVAIVNMNYRLVTGSNSTVHLSDIISDIDAAFSFLNTNRNTFGISNKFGIWGFSAGAHLATLYAYAYDTNNYIYAVGDWFAPTDFVSPQPSDVTVNSLFGGKNIYTLQKELLGEDRSVNPQLWIDASPLNRVTAATKPTIIMHDNADLVVPINDSYLLRNKLNSLGVNHSFIDISYYIQNHPSNIFQFNPPFHDFTDPGICNSFDCGVFNINDYRNYAVDTTINYMKRFL